MSFISMLDITSGAFLGGNGSSSSPSRHTMEEEPAVLWQSSQVVNIREMIQKAEQRVSVTHPSTTQARKRGRQHTGHLKPSGSRIPDETSLAKRGSVTESGSQSTSTSSATLSSKCPPPPLSFLGNSADVPICIGTQDSTRTIEDQEDPVAPTVKTIDLSLTRHSTRAVLTQSTEEAINMGTPQVGPSMNASSRRSALRNGHRSTSAKVLKSSSSRTQSTCRAKSWSVTSASSRGVSELATGDEDVAVGPAPAMDLQRLIRQFGSVVKERTATQRSSSAVGVDTKQKIGRKRMRSVTDEGRPMVKADMSLGEGSSKVLPRESKMRSRTDGRQLSDRTNHLPVESTNSRSSAALLDPNKPWSRPGMERTGSGAMIFPKRRIPDSDSDEEKYWRETSMESLDLHLLPKSISPRHAAPTLHQKYATPSKKTLATITSPLQAVQGEPTSSGTPSGRLKITPVNSPVSHQLSQSTQVAPLGQTRRLGITGHALAKAPPLSSQATAHPKVLSQYSTNAVGFPSKPRTLGMRIGGGRQTANSSSTPGSSRATESANGGPNMPFRPAGFKVPFRTPTTVTINAAAAQVADVPPPSILNTTAVKEKGARARATPTARGVPEDTAAGDDGSSGADSSFSFECDADQLNELMAQYD
ncbi:hypothetical protein FRB94_009133 [Tulasnella sp. JGI-2019a]|nr:hypothetical protein FRB94_009133 [Tulasnella sp. JGI-2019a]